MPPEKKIRLFCGTPSYMAPEIVTKKEYSGHTADIWALGVLLYAVLCGTFPYRGSTDKELYTKICRGKFYVPDHMSKQSYQFLCRLMTLDADKRPTALEVLKDPWFD